MHPRVSVNAVCTPRQSLTDDLALWSALGLRNAGLHRRKLDAAGWDTGIELVRASGLNITTIVHSNMYELERPETWASSTAEVIRVLEAAAAVGANSVYGTTGPAGTLSWEEAAGALGEAIEPALRRARELGVLLGMEPTNPVVGHSFVHSIADMTDVASQTGLSICVDTFWCARERDLARALARAMPSICLVQVADAPREGMSVTERAVPGDGRIPIERILGWALDAGYAGPFEIEVMGSGPEREGHGNAVARSARWLSDALERLGV